MKKNDLEFFNLDETAEWDRFEVEVAINEELKKSSDEEMLMESDTAIVKETKQIIAKKSLDEEYDYVPKKTVVSEKRQVSKKAEKKTAAASTKIKDGSSAKKSKKTKQLKESDVAVKSSTGKKKKSGKKSKKEEQGFFGDLLAYFQNMSLLDGLVFARLKITSSSFIIFPFFSPLHLYEVLHIISICPKLLTSPTTVQTLLVPMSTPTMISPIAKLIPPFFSIIFSKCIYITF